MTGDIKYGILAVRLAAASLLVSLVGFVWSRQYDAPIAFAMTPSLVRTNSVPAVPVHVYVEALCIDSKAYFAKQLMPTYETLGPMIMDLNIVVYGNAQISKTTDSVQCQHGRAECDANSYAQCAADVYHNVPTRYVPFIACLFDRLPMGHADTPFSPALFAACAVATALAWGPLQACHDDSSRAFSLQRRAAAATVNHTYVPWVMIGTTHIADSDTDSLLEQVCRTYVANGGSHAACTSTTSMQ